jgi:hypothetical protein
MARDEPRWHPLLAAVEGPILTWRMLDPDGREYGMIRLVRVGGEPKYRAEFRGQLIGYGGTLRQACERVLFEYIAAHAPQGGHAATYPIHTPSTASTNVERPVRASSGKA